MSYSHWITRKGFTSKRTSYFYILPLSRKNAVLGSLLARVLERGSLDYPSMEAIKTREDELYGAVAHFDVAIYGSMLCFEANLVFPDYNYFGKAELEKEARDFFESLLYRPLLANGLFNEEFFLQEKQMLREDLDSMMKEPQSYAMRRVMELIFGESKAGIYRYGDRETLEEVNIEDLSIFYGELLKSPLNIYHHGRDEGEDEGFWEPLDMDEVDFELLAREFTEERDISQSVSVQAYRVPIGFRDDGVYNFLVLSHLLGGMATSFLFKKIREERGLCYSIYSRYDRYRRTLFIISGHERDSFDEIVLESRRILESFGEGGFSVEELEEAKRDLSIGLASTVDSQSRHLRDVFVRDLFGDERNIDKRIKKIESVSKEDVMAAARGLEFNLAYLVRNK